MQHVLVEGEVQVRPAVEQCALVTWRKFQFRGGDLIQMHERNDRFHTGSS